MSYTCKKVISCSFNPALVEKIDEKRGTIPRSTFLEDVLTRQLFSKGECT